MNDVVKYMVSKEDFKKYFDCKNSISREEYIKYLRKKTDTLTDTLKYDKWYK